jgi:hypothetical protein
MVEVLSLVQAMSDNVIALECRIPWVYTWIIQPSTQTIPHSQHGRYAKVDAPINGCSR